MIKNQSNKVFLELLISSGVCFFSKNQANNFYTPKTNELFSKESTKKMNLKNIKTIDELAKFIKKSNQCLLKNTAKKTVVADGCPKAKLMIVGEAPGREEDEQGKPFVGQAGQLLNKMLAAINLQRKHVYREHIDQCLEHGLFLFYEHRVNPIYLHKTQLFHLR